MTVRPSVTFGIDADTGHEFRVFRDEHGRESLSHRVDKWATWSPWVPLDGAREDEEAAS